MSAELKTHMAVHGGGQTMIEKWLIGKRMINFKFTVMREPGLQRVTFLGFKIFKISQNFKTLFGYYLPNFCVLMSFQDNVLFFYQRIEVQKRKSVRKTFRYFSFFSKNIVYILYTWRMTNKFNWFYQPNLVGIRGNFCFQNGKSCISILHYAIFLLL